MSKNRKMFKLTKMKKTLVRNIQNFCDKLMKKIKLLLLNYIDFCKII